VRLATPAYGAAASCCSFELRYWITIWQTIKHRRVIISGVLGFQEGGRRANPGDYTLNLSAVIKLARLIGHQACIPNPSAEFRLEGRPGHKPGQCQGEYAGPRKVGEGDDPAIRDVDRG
jgi:hypothetical protein